MVGINVMVINLELYTALNKKKNCNIIWKLYLLDIIWVNYMN